MNMMPIGDRLRALRKSNNMTTQEIANKINITQSYLSRFENNRAISYIEMLERILHALGTDLSSFFSTNAEDLPEDLIQLIDTVKTLRPETRQKLDEFLKLMREEE